MENKELEIQNTYNRQQIDLIKRTVAKGATDDELKLFLHICKKSGLDPFANQIYLIPRWDSNINSFVRTNQTGIDGYRLVAERTGKYAPGKEPTFQYDKNGVLLSATSFIMKMVGDKWFEIGATAHFKEYCQRKKDGNLTHMWATKPHVMLAKCAEALALRRGFPMELSGIYTFEEMQAENIAKEENQKIEDLPTAEVVEDEESESPPPPKPAIPSKNKSEIKEISTVPMNVDKKESKKKPGKFYYEVSDWQGIKYLTFSESLAQFCESAMNENKLVILKFERHSNFNKLVEAKEQTIVDE